MLCCICGLILLPMIPTLMSSVNDAVYQAGVWNNFNFSRPADTWVRAARSYGGEKSVIDVVVAQANINGLVYLPFPVNDSDTLDSFTDQDVAKPYLDRFQGEGLGVILSIQPLEANVTHLLKLLILRYSHYDNIIGFNVDLEWKESGTAYHVTNEERDVWLNQIRAVNKNYMLFLTYYKDYTHFPQDTEGVVILFDGVSDNQQQLLRLYADLADHYNTVGLYTGYATSRPPSIDHETIMEHVPNTKFILHTDDAFDQFNDGAPVQFSQYVLFIIITISVPAVYFLIRAYGTRKPQG